ncbi:MAG: hypothetical protein ACI9CO_001513 [Candidatus Azotimanducaceae bacterium]|jgi:hypothetical protein
MKYPPYIFIFFLGYLLLLAAPKVRGNRKFMAISQRTKANRTIRAVWVFE